MSENNFSAEIEFNFTVKVPNLSGDTHTDVEAMIHTALEQGEAWLIELVMNTKWEIERVEVWPEEDDDCDHLCRKERHEPAIIAGTPIPCCNRCPGCQRRIRHGEMNPHLRSCRHKS